MKPLIYLVLSFFIFFTASAQQQKPNVLFIAVDDLRPELGCYGKSQIKSPNIDKLAESGLQFNRAYCNIPVCGASRASLLSGIRPNRHRFSTYKSMQDEDVPGVVSLPMHFKNNGYYTVSLGKVYHHKEDGEGSWSETPWRRRNQYLRKYVEPESLKVLEPGRFGIKGPAFESFKGPDHIYPDGMMAEAAMRQLRKFKGENQPFFLAVGFIKPHLPFNAPQKYWDMYNFDDIELPEYMKKPKNAPDAAMHNFGELRGYTDVPGQGKMEEEFMRKLIHGYYACVSYIDAQVGKVLNELERLGMAENTIVVLWGDHGWHLGEHGLWCKHCNFEKVLHTPLILRAPGGEKNIETDALVELVDIYPSLCQLAGLSMPFHIQGKSFVPLAKNPDLQWKDAVYSRWIEGETIVTKRYTYTEWMGENNEDIYANMLYDLNADPEETIDVSGEPENKELVKKLSEKLHQHMAERDRLIIQHQRP